MMEDDQVEILNAFSASNFIVTKGKASHTEGTKFFDMATGDMEKSEGIDSNVYSKCGGANGRG